MICCQQQLLVESVSATIDMLMIQPTVPIPMSPTGDRSSSVPVLDHDPA